MDISRISSRTWLRITLALVAVIVAAFLLNKLHKRSQSYEGIVVRIHWIRAFWNPRSGDLLLARIETPVGEERKADITYCGKISEGDYLVKRRGYECPTVVRRAEDMRSNRPGPGDIPLPRRNPDLTRQLQEYDESR